MEKQQRKHRHITKDNLYTAVILGIPPIALTLPLYLVLNTNLSADKAAAIPLIGVIIIAVSTILAS